MLSLELAARADALCYDDFSGEARKWAKDAIADMICCTLLGARAPITEAVLAMDTPAPGPCLAFGRRERLSRLDAALTNGTAGHALDYDDTSKSLSGHPTVIIMPGLLAVAEAADLSGARLLDAYIVGLETATRIARGVNFHHYEKGWHPTATLGIFGAAAACARLLDLSTGQIAHALGSARLGSARLGTAVSLAAGVKSNFGTPVKPLHAGMAARNGLMAALLAQRGIEASPKAFEHVQGFLEVFNGAGNYDAARMLEGWGDPLDLLEPGISIKKYPCVYSVHGAIDAVIALKQRAGLKPGDIRGVVVRMHPRRLLPHVLNPATSALNAKFSLSYAVACALVNGAVGLGHFENDAWLEPAVVRVMDTVATEPDEGGNDYGAEVRVTLADGTSLSETVETPLGRGPESPLPTTMLRAKFMDCAGRALTPEGASEVFEMLMELENVSSIRILTSAVAGGTR